MKKLCFYSMMSLMVLTACSNVAPDTDKIKDKKFVKVNTSELGLENAKNEEELHMTYDVNSEEAKKYQQLQEMEKDNKRYKDKEFKAFIREQDKNSR